MGEGPEEETQSAWCAWFFWEGGKHAHVAAPTTDCQGDAGLGGSPADG
jgi:hypothetical protein